MLTKDELAAIRERAEKATPGPWVQNGPFGLDIIAAANTESYDDDCDDSLAKCGWKRDAPFIAHARADVPALLAHIAELEAKLQRARDYAKCAEACEEYEGPVRWRWTDMAELLEGKEHREVPEVRE